MRALSHEFAVCAIDLPGSGRSSPLTDSPPLAFFDTFVGRFLAVLGRGPAVVVGHSLGGYVAARSAIHGTPSVKALMLVDAAGFAPVQHPLMQVLSMPVVGELSTIFPASRSSLRLVLRSFVHEHTSITDEMLDWASKSMGPRHNRAQIVYQLRLARYLERHSDEFFFHGGPPSPIPELVVWGRYDRVFPLETAYAAAATMGAPPPVVFEGSGHWPQVEESHRFNDVLRAFASSVARP